MNKLIDWVLWHDFYWFEYLCELEERAGNNDYSKSKGDGEK